MAFVDDQLKRACDDDGMEQMAQPPAKRMFKGEGPRVEVRFLIPSKMAGIIIGKSGQNINRLRQAYSAKVNVPDSVGPERILSIEGELGTVEDILADLLPLIISESVNQRGRKDSITDVRGNYTQACDDTNFDLRMLMHQSQAGCVIGRGGYKIKELREESGLNNVRVYGVCCPASTDRVIQLVGEPDKIVNTLHIILELVENSPPKGQQHYYDAGNFDEFNVDAYGGWMSGTGPRGAMAGGMRGGMAGAGGAGGMMFGADGGGGRGGGPGGMMGATGARGGPGGMMGRGGGGRGGPGGMMGRGGGGAGNVFRDGGGGDGSHFMGGGGNAGAGQFGFGRGGGGEVDTTQVSIPDNLTGSIMGRGGSRINQIREESGAAIKIDKGEFGCKDRIITITGTQEQIQNAQYLLQLCVKRYSGQY